MFDDPIVAFAIAGLVLWLALGAIGVLGMLADRRARLEREARHAAGDNPARLVISTGEKTRASRPRHAFHKK